MKTHNLRFLAFVGIGLASVAMARAESYKVKITPQPAEVTVSVKDYRNKEVEVSKQRFGGSRVTGRGIRGGNDSTASTPAVEVSYYVLSFRNDKDVNTITLTAPDFEPLTRTVSKAEIEALPANDKELRELPLILHKRFSVRLNATPSDAQVEMSDQSGKSVLARSTCPQTTDFIFEADKLDSTLYTIRFTRKDFDPQEQRLDVHGVEALTGANNVRELKVALRSLDFQEVDQKVITFDRQKGLVGRIKKSRAFRQDSEASGRIPSRIYELPSGLGVRGLALSPDGTRLVFSEAEFDKASEGADFVAIKACNMKAITLGQRGVSQLTSSAYRDVDPAFTADDGQHLLFASNLYRNLSTDLLQISAQGKGGIQRIYQDSRGWAVLSPSMGADGTIAYALHPNNEDPRALPEIWTTGGIKKFETNLTKGEQPQVSPDGSKIVFVDPDHNLSIINCDGNRLTQLTPKAKTILDSLEKKLTPAERDDFQKHPELYLPYSNPSWSPDGKFIIYSSLEGTDSTGRPNEDIWIMPSDGGTATQVTSNGSADIYPVISPDKKTIYFISNRVNGWAIYRIESPPELLGGQ